MKRNENSNKADDASRDAKKAAVDTTTPNLQSVLRTVIGNGCFCWYEALQLASLSKGCYKIWKVHGDSLPDWKRLLEWLENQTKTNYCLDCSKLLVPTKECTCRPRNPKTKKKELQTLVAYSMSDLAASEPKKKNPFRRHDPRFNPKYQSLPIRRKCQQMTIYRSWIIANFHSYFDLEHLEQEDQSGFQFFEGYLSELEETCPRRYTLVSNLICFVLAWQELHGRVPYWFKSAFAGEGFYPSTGSSWDNSFTDTFLFEMSPPTNDRICHSIREHYPSSEELALLGPAVARKLVLLSPFFDMCPPDPKAPAQLPHSLENLPEALESVYYD